MIQRALLRQCRVAAQTVRAPSRTSLLRPQFHHVERSLQPASSARWYATEPEATKASNGEADIPGAAKPEAEDSINKELEAKTKEVIDLKDKYLRSVADFRNLQERTKREVQQARDFALQKFAKDLIESVDNLDRALSMVPAEKLSQTEKSEAVQDLVNLYEGLKMTDSILMSTLKKHGLERFDPAEGKEKFNPNEHEATFMTKMEGREDGEVFLTQSKGFKLNGRVLRAAKVGVVKNS